MILVFGDGVSAIEIPIRPELTFDGHAAQGGFVGTLAAYAAVSTPTASMPEGWLSATTGYEVQNLGPAIGSKLVGVGRTIKNSKSSAVAAADVFAEQSGTWAHVATCLATCRLFSTSQ